MSFLEDLPSVPSSRFSRKDIELFDTQMTLLSGSPGSTPYTYRERYRKGVNVLKDLLSRTQTTIDVDLLREYEEKYGYSIIGGGSREYTEYVIWRNSDPSNKFWLSKYPYNKGPRRPRTLIKPILEDGYTMKEMNCINITAVNDISSNACDDIFMNRIHVRSKIIMAFYIPEDLEWFKLTWKDITDDIPSQVASDDLIIGYYEKDYDPPQKDLDLSLESILQRTNDYSFLDEYNTEDLENLLKNSKKRMLLPTCTEEEIVEIKGKRYKRITLIHPGIVNILKQWLYIVTSDHAEIYYEEIRHNYLTKTLGHPWGYYYCEIYLCDLGPKGYKLIQIEGSKMTVLYSFKR